MFCSKCGNPLPDNAKFCNTCGAPVKISQETWPVPQQPAGIPDETVNIQATKSEPLMEAENFSVQMSSGAATHGKKSKKELDVMGKDRNSMIDFLLAAYEGEPEYQEQEKRLEALTDTQLKEEYEAVWEKVMSDVDRNDLLEFAH